MSQPEPEKSCFYCSSTDQEMRPYGPGGSWICPCIIGHPEREKAAQQAFGALLDAAIAMGHGTAVATPEGPQPLRLPLKDRNQHG